MTKPSVGDHLRAGGPLTRAYLPRNTIELARFLLGHSVQRNAPEGQSLLRITETEAYPPGDPAAHAYRRMTPRNRSLFAECGTAYVYRAYGVCWMLNVASEVAGIGAGVLIRAGEPIQGVALMQMRRGPVPHRDLARGPGRLAAALAIDRGLDGVDLCAGGPLSLVLGSHGLDAPPAEPIGVSVRIGITRAVDRPWRFFLRGNRSVSGPAALNQMDV